MYMYAFASTVCMILIPAVHYADCCSQVATQSLLA